MKKLFALITVLCMVFSMTSVCAKTFTNNEMGLSFIMSDDWHVLEQTENSVVFAHRWSSNEQVAIYAISIDDAYDVDMFDEEFLNNYCKDYYSNQKLAQNLNKANDTYGISIVAEDEQCGYIVLGDTKYYRYEKAYTASAYGFYDQGFYDTAFLTAKNGKFYQVEYGRDDDLNENHFADIVAMLESMSYAEGETKIYVDGQRVISDSAPMIISGRTLVPIRAVAEKMGYNVIWNDATQTAIITGKYNLEFTIDSSIAVRDANAFALDVPALMFNSRTYLPLRAVAEAMDAKVEWNADENAVYITSPQY